MSTLQSLLQKDISIITIRDIRYEGKLYSYDPNNFTVTLQDVRNMGTEGRVTSICVEPSDEILDFIVYNARHIKSFQPISRPAENVIDPAIVSCVSDERAQVGSSNPKASGHSLGGNRRVLAANLPSTLSEASNGLPHSGASMLSGMVGMGGSLPFGTISSPRSPNKPQQQQQQRQQGSQRASPPASPKKGSQSGNAAVMMSGADFLKKMSSSNHNTDSQGASNNVRMRSIDISKMMAGGSSSRQQGGGSKKDGGNKKQHQQENDNKSKEHNNKGDKKKKGSQQDKQQRGGAMGLKDNHDKGSRHVSFKDPSDKSSKGGHRNGQRDAGSQSDSDSSRRNVRAVTHIPLVPRGALMNRMAGDKHQRQQSFGGRQPFNQRSGGKAQDKRARSAGLLQPGEFAKPKNATVKFDVEYDFDKAMEEFKELSVCDSKKPADAAADSGEAKERQAGGAETPKEFYNREVSFYDNLSTTVEASNDDGQSQRASGSHQRRQARKQEMLTNKETFGVTGVRRQYYRRSGGHSGGRFLPGMHAFRRMVIAK